MTRAINIGKITIHGKTFKFGYDVCPDTIEVPEEVILSVYHEVKDYILDELDDPIGNRREDWVRTGHSFLQRELFVTAQADLLDRTAGLSPNLRALLGSLIERSK